MLVGGRSALLVDQLAREDGRSERIRVAAAGLHLSGGVGERDDVLISVVAGLVQQLGQRVTGVMR